MQDLSNVACERAVLAGLFQHGSDALIDVGDIVNTQTFTLESNQILFKCFEQALKSGAAKLDVPTILAVAQQLGLAESFKSKSEREHLRAITNFQIEKENVRVHAQTIAKLEVARALYSTLGQAQSDVGKVSGSESISHILNLAEGPITRFTTSVTTCGTNEPVQLGANAPAYFEHLAKNPRQYSGLPTFYSLMDKSMGGGLPLGGTTIVSARLKAGKSLIGNAVAIKVAAKLSAPIFVADSEMNLERALSRAVASLASVDVEEVRTGKFSLCPMKTEKVQRAAAFLSKLPITYLSIAQYTIEEVIAIIRRWVLRTVGLNENGRANPCLVIYDYIRVHDVSELRYLQEHQVLGLILTNLNNLAIQYNLPVLTFAQVNREGITREDTGVIAGSDRLAAYCSALFLLKNKDEEEMAEEFSQPVKYNCKMIPLAMRDGFLLGEKDYINFRRVGEFAQMIEGETRNARAKLQQKVDAGFEVVDESNPGANTDSSATLLGENKRNVA